MVSATPHDAADRRRYWSSQLEAAHAFMQRMFEYPVQECGEPAVPLRDAARAAGVTVVFSETQIAGSYPRQFLLREGLIPAFVAAARDMNQRGWVLKVEDGYRTTEMQRHLSLAPYVLDQVLAKVIWELDGGLPSADLFFRRLMVLTATAPKIGTHMSASAIDISVLRQTDGTALDRGGPYIEMSERTPMLSPFVSAEASRNRALLSLVMGAHGFMAYPYEFWHYSQGDAYDESLTGSGRPARYGAVAVDPASGSVTPIANACASLHAPDDFRRAMEEALARLQQAPAAPGR
jgi:D-alanyl-D-alanine dipeptidase